MNMFSFAPPTVHPDGDAPNIEQPLAHPNVVTMYGTQTVAPFTMFDYTTGTYMGTNPPCLVHTGTAVGVTAYTGTYYAAFWGFEVPYGWTGTIAPGFLSETTGTLKAKGLYIYSGTGVTENTRHVFVIS